MGLLSFDFVLISMLGKNDTALWLILMFIEGYLIGAPYMLASAAICSDIDKREKNSRAISTVAGLLDGAGSLFTAIFMIIVP